ncbi:MAG: hypothetical protein KGL39_00745 [Patescibacteria group bacterium]|nr:hypothetical protein [Patescibacteria group bacterium]
MILTSGQQDLFLFHYQKTGAIRLACLLTGVSRLQLHYALKASSDFQKKFFQAQETTLIQPEQTKIMLE